MEEVVHMLEGQRELDPKQHSGECSNLIDRLVIATARDPAIWVSMQPLACNFDRDLARCAMGTVWHLYS
ncbi:MAG: hypothetical protein JST28_06310 [Acidobacteria bacterium]|nr:hypothetical protein [Acidobacteriota bacterium]